MVIKYAILGHLSRAPQTGYGLKEALNDSPALYGSGSSIQIYKTLVQLLKEGLAASEVRKEADNPAKKVYLITESGLSELKKWVVSTPEPSQTNNPFLARLAMSELLEDSELNALLEKYENEVNMQLLMQQEKIRRGITKFENAQVDAHLWQVIMERVMSTYENELHWIGKLREEYGKSVKGRF